MKVDVDVAVYGFMPGVTLPYRGARAVKGVRQSAIWIAGTKECRATFWWRWRVFL